MLLLASLGGLAASILVIPRERTAAINLDSTKGWMAIETITGETVYYHDVYGFVQEGAELSQRQIQKIWMRNNRSIILSQIGIILAAFLLLMAKRISTTPMGIQVNLAFGYLGLVWATMLVFIIQLTNSSLVGVHIGNERMILYAEQVMEYLKPEAFTTIAIGLGVPLTLSYLFIRWAWKNRAESVFP